MDNENGGGGGRVTVSLSEAVRSCLIYHNNEINVVNIFWKNSSIAREINRTGLTPLLFPMEHGRKF